MSDDANALVALFESLTGDELTWLMKRVVSRNVARPLPRVPPEIAAFAAEILCEHERHYAAVREILRRAAARQPRADCGRVPVPRLGFRESR
jgi:hypothetical protein